MTFYFDIMLYLQTLIMFHICMYSFFYDFKPSPRFPPSLYALFKFNLLYGISCITATVAKNKKYKKSKYAEQKRIFIDEISFY